MRVRGGAWVPLYVCARGGVQVPQCVCARGGVQVPRCVCTRGGAQVPQYCVWEDNFWESVLTHYLAETRLILLFLPCCVFWTDCPWMAKSPFFTLVFYQSAGITVLSVFFFFLMQVPGIKLRSTGIRGKCVAKELSCLISNFIIIIINNNFWDRVSLSWGWPWTC